MEQTDRATLEAYSRGNMDAIEARRRLRGATFGELLQLLGEAGLKLPRAPALGREEQIARARRWMFPHDTDA